ncbi:hypothetical protein JYT31_03505, partial [Beggiatoa alba]|nr:hypothetical protein [Beggiatoa alba]
STINALTVNFSMTSMNMGLNKFGLKKNQDHWQTSILLPVCISKRTDWKMKFFIETANKIYKTDILLQIK